MIALLGSTGTIGSFVAERVAEAGMDARAVARSGGTADSSLPTVHGDLRDPASLERAFDGAEVLFLLTPHDAGQDILEQNALDAAVAAGVKRIVKISGSAPSLGPNGPTPTAIAHWRSEQRIEKSGLSFQFLRPSFLMQNLLDIEPRLGMLMAPMGRSPIAMVDARDVADCAAALLIDESPGDGAWQLTGPSGVAFSDVAKLQGVRYVNVPVAVARKALLKRGLSPHEAEHSIQMARFFAAGADAAPTGCVEDLTGHAPRSIQQFFESETSKKGSH